MHSMEIFLKIFSIVDNLLRRAIHQCANYFAPDHEKKQNNPASLTHVTHINCPWSCQLGCGLTFHFISAVHEKNILHYRDTILILTQKAHGKQTGNTCFYLCILVFGDYLSCFSIILYKSHVTCHVTICHFVNIMTQNLDCIYGGTRFPSGSTSVACGL